MPSSQVASAAGRGALFLMVGITGGSVPEGLPLMGALGRNKTPPNTLAGPDLHGAKGATGECPADEMGRLGEERGGGVEGVGQTCKELKMASSPA